VFEKNENGSSANNHPGGTMEIISRKPPTGTARKRLARKPGVIVGLACLAIAQVCLGQGTITLNNRVPGVVIAPVYSCDPDCTQRTGNTPTGYPPGTQVYSGAPLAGAGYTAQLWYAPGAGQPEDALIPAAQTTFLTDSLAGFLVPVTIALPGVVPGMEATLQLRVWDNRGGSVTSWAQAVSDPTVARGASPLFVVENFGDGGPLPPATLMGLVSFNICAYCPPLILTQPQNQLTLAGGTAGFSVTASGAEPLGYRWKLNGINLTDGGHVSGATNQTLVISNVQSGDIGAYSVTVSNAFGTVTSETAKLDLGRVLFTGIQIAGPVGTVQFPTITGCVYEVQSSPVTTGPWFLDEIVAGNGGTNVLAFAPGFPAQYFRLAAYPIDGGLITYSENLVGYANQAVSPGTNMVFNPFKNLRLQDAIPHAPDGTVVLIPNGTGYDVYFFDELLFQWVPTGSVVLPAGTDFRVLTSTAFTFTLAGEVSDQLITEPPAITLQPMSQTVAVGSNAVLSVSATGTPPLSYQWLFTGAPLPGATASTLLITDVGLSHAGGYQALVSNAYGSATSTVAILTVTAPPALIYAANFESEIGPEWSSSSSSTTPAGSRRFLGEFGNQTVALTLTNLPPHNVATVGFDLFIIRSWDGNAGAVGPDIWSLQLGGGPVLLRTTFGTGHPYSYAAGQAFPGVYPGTTFPVNFGASETNSLGYTFADAVFSGPMDAVYHLEVPFEHIGDNLVLNFAASGLQSLSDESWGLDNVTVSLQTDSAGVLAFSTAGASVGESDGNLTLNVSRIGGATGTVSVDYAIANGTATAGSDYIPAMDTLTFADGETNKTITIPILNDAVHEPNETFEVSLSHPEGGAILGVPSTIPVLIHDDDTVAYSADFEGPIGPEWSPGRVTTTPAGARRFLGEFGNETVTLTLTNLPPHSAVELSLDLFVIRSWDGNQVSYGPDIWDASLEDGRTLFHATFSNHRMAPYLFSQSYPAPYPEGQFPAGYGAAEVNTLGYTFNFSQAGTQPADSVYHLTLPFTHTGPRLVVSFRGIGLQGLADESWGLDNVSVLLQTTSAGILAFSTAGASVLESGGSVAIRVSRIGGASGSVSVDYATTNGTATADSDYTPVNGTLVFADGETNKTIMIPILGDAIPEPNESFQVILSNPAGGAVLGAPTDIPVMVVDDDGILEFSQPAFTVAECSAALSIPITWTGATDSDVTVQVSTSDGTAIAGSDYSAWAGWFTIPAGQTSASISVPINDDAFVEGDEVFYVSLASPSLGASLGTQTNIVVTILDNDTATGAGFGVNWTIEAMTVQPDGKVLIGGGFDQVNAFNRAGVARLNPDGSVDTGFDPGSGANGWVESIALEPDGKAVIGGRFTTVNGIARNRIARMNRNGTVDLTFDPGAAANGIVHNVAVQPDSKVLLAGAFTTVNGVARNRVARLNADGSLDLTFNPGEGANDVAWALALQADGRIVVSGGFTSFDGVSRTRLARLNPDGSLDTSFNTSLSLRANAIIPLADGKLLLGGRFATVNGVTVNRMARLNPDGTLDPAFSVGSGPDGDVQTLVVQSDGKILAGGNWSVWDGLRLQHLVRLGPGGAVDRTLGIEPGANGYVGAMAVLPDDRVAVAGNFSVLNGFNRYRFALLNADGSQPEESINWVQWPASLGGNDHWYAPSSRPKDWISAETEAVAAGGHLVAINDGPEQTFLESTFLKGLNRIRPFWIGLNDAASEGNFVWSSGEPVTYTNWTEGEPNDFSPGEDYAVLNWHYSDRSGAYPAALGQWNDVPLPGTFLSWQSDGPYFGIIELLDFLAPEIVVGPQSQPVAVGSNAVFTVSATGTPPLAYQWLFNGVALPGATVSRLVIYNALASDGGRYRAVVSNSAGSVTSPVATLAVITPPEILEPPRSAQVTLGSPVSFDVAASSSGPLSYQWFFDGVPIPGATAARYTIASAQYSDEGSYSVLVESLAGSVMSDPAGLFVVPPPEPPIILSSYVVSIRPGLNLIANQLNRGGNTLREIMPAVPDGSVVSKFDNASQAWVRSRYSAALAAWVPANITLRPGEGAFFESATNFPLTFRGTPQTPVLPVVIPEGQVYLLSRQTNDIGTYENIVGADPNPGAVVYKWDTSNATYAVYTYTEDGWSGGVAPTADVGEALWIGPAGGMPTEIPSPPVITEQPVSTTVLSGGTAMFTVVASGTEPLSYQWRLNGNKIPGATGSALLIPDVQPASAGDYSVVIKNLIGAVSSEPASLTISGIAVLAFADDFAEAGDLGGAASGTGTGNNSGATVEPGEPIPAHTPGGASLWLRWVAPGNGIARFNTAGSSFDTLLAVYIGSSLSNLVAVASDDDSAAFLCSAVEFRAGAGMTYYIQVDGFYGARGTINLAWEFSEIPYEPPVILVQPQGVTVPAGSNAVLTVTIAEGPIVSYQWLFDGVPICGATDFTLGIFDMTPDQAGLYQVAVTNIQTLAGTLSMPANVQYIAADEGQRGNPADVSARDKFHAATDLTPPDPNIPDDPAPAGSFTGTQTFSTAGSTSDPGEPNHCGYPPCATYWCSYEAPASGLLTVDTRGTKFNAVLAVYTGPGTDYSSLAPVACSANHGAGNESVTFAATSGTKYWVVIGGINCASGSATINYNLSATPNFTTLPVSQTVSIGAAVTLTATAVGAPVLGYQWRFNGTDISGATRSAYTVSSFQTAHEGTYAVVATNVYGTNVTAPAYVFLNDPRFITAGASDTSFSAQFVGQVSASYIFETSTDLLNWLPLKTNSSPLGIMTFTDPMGSAASKFYRVRKR